MNLYSLFYPKVRGDGRSYMLNLASVGYFDVTWNDMHNYILFTRGGPHWQISKVTEDILSQPVFHCFVTTHYHSCLILDTLFEIFPGQ